MWVWTQVAEMKTDLPAFLTNPTSASTAWQMSQQKQSGCQLLFMALITRPMMNSPWAQNKRTRWKSRRLSGRLLFKSASVAAGGKKKTCVDMQCLHLPHWWQQGAKSIWKSCSQYFRPSNCQRNSDKAHDIRVTRERHELLIKQTNALG